MSKAQRSDADQPQGLRVGKNLHRLRTAAGLSRRELADMAALAYSHIGLIERGLRPRLSGETIERLAQALGVPLESLTVAPVPSGGRDV